MNHKPIVLICLLLFSFLVISCGDNFSNHSATYVTNTSGNGNVSGAAGKLEIVLSVTPTFSTLQVINNGVITDTVTPTYSLSWSDPAMISGFKVTWSVIINGIVSIQALDRPLYSWTAPGHGDFIIKVKNSVDTISNEVMVSW